MTARISAVLAVFPETRGNQNVRAAEGPGSKDASMNVDKRWTSMYVDGTVDAVDEAEGVARLVGSVDSPDPVVGLRAVASLRTLVERLEVLHVRNARERGWSWEQIGAALGVSKQAVHRKHAAGKKLLRGRRG